MTTIAACPDPKPHPRHADGTVRCPGVPVRYRRASLACLNVAGDVRREHAIAVCETCGALVIDDRMIAHSSTHNGAGWAWATTTRETPE